MRPIDADALCEYFVQAFKKNRFVSLTYSEYMNAVRVFPTIDPVRRGKWERMVNAYGEIEGFMCECGCQSASAPNFCPSCGCDMRGDS